MESRALLDAQVNKFVALFRGMSLEKTPHASYYESGVFERIRNKPTWSARTGSGAGRTGGTPGGGKAPGGTAVKSAVQTLFAEGLCIWWIAGKLSMTNKNNVRYECRAPAGTHKHKQLSQVTQKTVLKLLDDPAFTAVCSQDALKTAIRAKAVAELWHFKV